MTIEEDMEVMDDYEKFLREADRKTELRNARVMRAIKSVKGREYHDELVVFLEEESGIDSKFSIVRKTTGNYQEEEGYNLIKGSWVNQYVNGGYTGDTFEGDCFIELKPGRYLKFHYSM